MSTRSFQSCRSDQLDGAQVEIQVFRLKTEATANLTDGLLELHERRANGLDLRLGERMLLHAADRLTLHQLSQELDDRQYQLGDRFLDIFGLRVPSRRRDPAALLPRGRGGGGPGTPLPFPT